MGSVLRLDALRSARLVAGASGMDNIVTSVSVLVDAYGIKMAKKGDLLVTTVNAFREQSAEDMANMLPRLSEAGVVGLGIKLNEKVPEVSQRFIQQANDLRFPLFVIPADVTFSMIITPVLTTIVNNQSRTLLDIYDLQKALTATMLQGGNLQSIAQTLFRRFGNSVAIYNDFFGSHVLACNEQRREVVGRRIENALRGRKEVRDPSASHMSHREVDNLDGLICSRISIPIYSDNEKYGSIFIWEDNREITNVDLAVLEAATSLIALDMIKKISMFEMENNHKATFLDDLLVRDEERQRKSLANAEYFDFDVEAEHQVAVIRVLTDSLPEGSGSSLYKINNSIVNVLRRICNSHAHKVLFVNKCDSIVLIFENPLRGSPDYAAGVREFLRLLLEALDQEGLSAAVSVGIGRIYGDATSLWKSFEEARRAAACVRVGGSRVHYFEKLGVYRFLSYENLQPELATFYSETLKVLVDYDHDRDSELVHTLRLYFKCGGNLKRLAEEMGVHYNTVAYRIQRIKELAQVSFDNADQLLNLQIALKIYDIRAK